MARTHVRIKGQNLNFYLETHKTKHNLHFRTAKNSAQKLGTLHWRVDDP